MPLHMCKFVVFHTKLFSAFETCRIWNDCLGGEKLVEVKWSEVKWCSSILFLQNENEKWKEGLRAKKISLALRSVHVTEKRGKREGVGRQIENNHHSIQHTIHSESINLNPFSEIIMRNCYSEMLQMSRTNFGISKFLFIYMCKVNTRQPITLNAKCYNICIIVGINNKYDQIQLIPSPFHLPISVYCLSLRIRNILYSKQMIWFKNKLEHNCHSQLILSCKFLKVFLWKKVRGFMF
jgi:hypothetical protein